MLEELAAHMGARMLGRLPPALVGGVRASVVAAAKTRAHPHANPSDENAFAWVAFHVIVKMNVDCIVVKRRDSMRMDVRRNSKSSCVLTESHPHLHSTIAHARAE